MTMNNTHDTDYARKHFEVHRIWKMPQQNAPKTAMNDWKLFRCVSNLRDRFVSGR